MLSRLTRLTPMSSHIVGGLSHLWDDRTAPNTVAKGTTQDFCGLGHDHGYYCVNKLADDISVSLTTNDDPFLGVPHVESRAEWNDPIISNRTLWQNDVQLDLGARMTPEDELPWYEKFDVTSNFVENFCEARRSRNNSTSNAADPELPSAFMNSEFSLLNECDWMSPTFHSNFLNDSLLSLEKPCSNVNIKQEDRSLEPLSENSNYSESLYSRSAESPLIEDADEEKKYTPELEVEYSNTGRIKRQCRRKTVADIMREACEVPDFDKPVVLGKIPKHALTFDSYFATKDVTSRLDRPKVRGVVIKPYVDAATFRRRVMNRESARKYRARKRREKFQVKGLLLDLEKRNVDLKVEIVSLEHEIISMKKQMNM